MTPLYIKPTKEQVLSAVFSITQAVIPSEVSHIDILLKIFFGLHLHIWVDFVERQLVILNFCVLYHFDDFLCCWNGMVAQTEHDIVSHDQKYKW